MYEKGKITALKFLFSRFSSPTESFFCCLVKAKHILLTCKHLSAKDYALDLKQTVIKFSLIAVER